MAEGKTPDHILPAVRRRAGNPNGNPDWGKGKPSPNPGGRPKSIGEVRALAQSRSMEAMQTLIDQMDVWKTAVVNVGTPESPMYEADAKVMAVSQRAAEHVLAYAVGRPGVVVDLGDTSKSLLERLADAMTEKDPA